jgi:hypothetical protein
MIRKLLVQVAPLSYALCLGADHDGGITRWERPLAGAAVLFYRATRTGKPAVCGKQLHSTMPPGDGGIPGRLTPSP